MRSLAEHLDVKPMARYHYVANKNEIIDGIVDLVYGEIALPTRDGDWLLQSRTAPRPATLRHHDAIIGALRGAGFSVTMTAHAFALLDSHIYGFSLSEATLPNNGPKTVAETAESMMQQYSIAAYPSLLEFSNEHIRKPDDDSGRGVSVRARPHCGWSDPVDARF